jgi:hypothetical protein
MQKISNLSLSQLPVSKTTFCNLAIEWCHSNISHPKCIKPNLRLSYYPHKSRGGVYYSSSHECVIYVNSHNNIKQVTITILLSKSPTTIHNHNNHHQQQSVSTSP